MKRAVLYILWIAILITSACKGEGEAAEAPSEPAVEEAPKESIFYTLSADVYPEEGGLVYPMEAEVPAETMIEVEAIPVPGYEFEGWSGASSDSSPNLSLTMDGDKQLTAHFTLKLTPTPEATLTPTPMPCLSPAEVTQDDVGKSVTVCGKVTNYGLVEECPECQYKRYSFIKLDNEYVIYSFHWEFEPGWLGACLTVVDTVELYGVKPVFILDKGEAEAGSECRIVEIERGYHSNGITPVRWDVHRCPAGDYFQPFSACEDGHFNLPDLTHFNWKCLNPATK